MVNELEFMMFCVVYTTEEMDEGKTVREEGRKQRKSKVREYE